MSTAGPAQFLPWLSGGLVALHCSLQVGTAAYALHLDRERYGPLWTPPFQQVVYRQLMYLVVIQSTVMALLGGRLRWQRMARIGAVAGNAAEAGARRG